MTQEAVLSLLTWAASMTGYNVPDAQPTVQFVSEAWMGQVACPKNPDNCKVIGLYDDDNHIFIIEGLTWKAKDHVLLHELIHFLQHHSGKFDLHSCQHTALREQEAYRLQALYIWQVQNDFGGFLPPPMTCNE